MQASIPIAIAGLVGITSLGWAAKTVLAGPKAQIKPGDKITSTGAPVGVPVYAPPKQEQEITLKALSILLWNKPVNGRLEVDYEKMAAALWGAKKETLPPEEPPVEFDHPELTDFYNNSVLGRKFIGGNVLKAAEEILKYLDIHGDCSSLTNHHPLEKEGTAGEKSQEVYARVLLWQHSLNTARAMFELTSQEEFAPLSAKGLIAALGHDLGKIPRYYDQYKHSEPHQGASIGCLENMNTVKTLPMWNEIKEAIQLHHDKSSKQLPILLAQADQMARRMELNDRIDHGGVDEMEGVEVPVAVEQASPSPSPTPNTNCQSQTVDNLSVETVKESTVKPQDASTTSTPNAVTSQQQKPQQMSLNIPTNEYSPDSIVPVEGWLTDIPDFISYLGQYINHKVPGSSDSFWSAIMKDGFVYYRRKDFISVVQGYSQQHPDVESNLLNPQVTDNLLYSIIRALDAHTPSPVANHYLKKRRYTAKFMVTVIGKTAREQSFIPFHAKAFTERMAEIKTREARKSIANIEKITWVEEL